MKVDAQDGMNPFNIDKDGEVEDMEWVKSPLHVDGVFRPRTTRVGAGLDKMRVEQENIEREQAIAQLEAAARHLRDCEVARNAAGADYRIALDRFNAVVAPLPK